MATGQKNIRKKQKAPTFVGASEIESELGNLANDQTNPEGRARLTRRLIMDLVCIVIFEAQYSTVFTALSYYFLIEVTRQATAKPNHLQTYMPPSLSSKFDLKSEHIALSQSRRRFTHVLDATVQFHNA